MLPSHILLCCSIHLARDSRGPAGCLEVGSGVAADDSSDDGHGEGDKDEHGHDNRHGVERDGRGRGLTFFVEEKKPKEKKNANSKCVKQFATVIRTAQ